jgi:DNA-binding MarR family transcriptional regulator
LNDPFDRLANLLGAFALGVADRIRSAALEQSSLGGETAAAIVVIRHAPGLSIDQLGRVLGLSHAGTVRLVDRLAAAGLAVRSAAAHDRRAVALTLTPAGEVHQAALLNRRNEALVAILSEVSVRDRIALERIVAAMLQRLPDDAVSALNVCRFCDAERCADCPMDVFGPLDSSRRPGKP